MSKRIQKQADEMDSDLFRVMDRAYALYELTKVKAWMDAVLAIRQARAAVRSQMSEADREATQG